MLYALLSVNFSNNNSVGSNSVVGEGVNNSFSYFFSSNFYRISSYFSSFFRVTAREKRCAESNSEYEN